MSEQTPLDRLHTAVQSFSNEISDGPDDSGMVTAALVIWEELSYDDDGDPTYRTLYASTGDSGGRPTVAQGLAVDGMRKLTRDIHGEGE